MKRFFQILGILGALGSAAYALPNATESIPAEGGSIRITPIYNASLQIEWKDVIFHINPSSAGDYKGAKKPDIILITNAAVGTWDEKGVSNLMTRTDADDFGRDDYESYFSGCTTYAPKPVAVKLKPLELEQKFNMKVKILLNNVTLYEEREEAYSIDVAPAYQGNANSTGYVLTLGGKRIYIAGDTQITPEMKTLKNIDIAFLPMNSSSNLTPQQAAVSARAFKPKVVYPYNYRYPFDKINDNPQQFAKALEGSGIQVKLRGWYAHPALAAVAKPKP